MLSSNLLATSATLLGGPVTLCDEHYPHALSHLTMTAHKRAHHPYGFADGLSG